MCVCVEGEGGGGRREGSNDRHAVCGFSVVSYMYVCSQLLFHRQLAKE